MDIVKTALDYFGPAGAAVAIVSGSYALGVVLEDNITPEARSDFARYLRSGKLGTTASRIPDGTLELFERIFGDRHFSWKCLRRSLLFSIASLIGVFLLTAVLYRDFLWNWGVVGNWRTAPAWIGDYQIHLAILWAIWGLLPDYFNLLKTRIILRWLSTGFIRNPIYLPVLLIADFAFGYAAFACFITILATIPDLIIFGSKFTFRESMASLVLRRFEYPVYVLTPFHGGAYFVIFFASLVPSIWLWMWMIATFASRLLSSVAEKIMSVRYLDLNMHSIRIVGGITGVFLCLAYGAIRVVGSLN